MSTLWECFADWLFCHPGLQLHPEMNRMEPDGDLQERLEASFSAALTVMQAPEGEAFQPSPVPLSPRPPASQP